MPAIQFLGGRLIKILHVISTIDPGGAERHLLALCAGLAGNKDFDLSVAFLKGSGQLARQFRAIGIDVYDLSVRGKMRLATIAKLSAIIRGNEWCMVHTHSFVPDLIGGLLAARFRVPVRIASEHNDADHYRAIPIICAHNLLSRLQQRIIVISEHLRVFFEDRKRVHDPSKIRVVHYGLPLSRVAHIERSDAREALLHELGVDESTFVIGTVGRLHRAKGHRYLLEAMPDTLEKEPQAVLVVVGQGELQSELSALADKLGVGTRVFFLGWRPDVPELMKAFDVFVCPSIWEGFGMVLLEAMAAERPIVASNVSAIPEIVLDGETGILVPPKMPAALSEAIIVLARDSLLRQEMGCRGRQRAIRHFTVERMVQQTADVYKELVREHCQVRGQSHLEVKR